MIRIIFANLALVFMQPLVNSQDPCAIAQANLASNPGCIAAFSSGTDTDAMNTICMGTCRYLFDAIINDCDPTVS